MYRVQKGKENSAEIAPEVNQLEAKTQYIKSDSWMWKVQNHIVWLLSEWMLGLIQGHLMSTQE